MIYYSYVCVKIVLSLMLNSTVQFMVYEFAMVVRLKIVSPSISPLNTSVQVNSNYQTRVKNVRDTR